jgi:hypothetical protein
LTALKDLRTAFCVHKLQRNQRLSLWQQYTANQFGIAVSAGFLRAGSSGKTAEAKDQKSTASVPSGNSNAHFKRLVNEMHLFHGSKDDLSICDHGLQPALGNAACFLIFVALHLL